MKKLFFILFFLLVSACGKKVVPAGTLGTCTVTFLADTPVFNFDFCTDYTFTTTSTKDLTTDVRSAASTACEATKGIWKADETCSLTFAVGHCTITTSKTVASDSYTLLSRQVFGVQFAGSSDTLKSYCEGLNVQPVTSVWVGL